MSKTRFRPRSVEARAKAKAGHVVQKKPKIVGLANEDCGSDS